MLIELNLDGLIGPTHHYGGMGVGNVASQSHAFQESFPQSAAMEGLDKMWRLVQLGLPQAFLPPSPRPNLPWLSALGFCGTAADQLRAAAETSSELLSAASSSAFMWTANAATVSPSPDCRDGRLHLTIANLASNLHRGQEASERLSLIGRLFEVIPSACIHAPLPSLLPLRDEGAANHMRLCSHETEQGIEIFVYGSAKDSESSHGFSARQTRMASEAIARLHQLDPHVTFFLKQNPVAIEAGVFHNDVIATSHEHLLMYHEDAFLNAEETLQQIARAFERTCRRALIRKCVPRDQLSLADAVTSYLFNSQIVTPRHQGNHENGPGPLTGAMHMLSPVQCKTIPAARRVIQSLLDDPENPIQSVDFVPLDQSMANGGGPACLRLRVSLTEEQFRAFPSQYLLNAESYQSLRDWILEWYPQRIIADDLARTDLAEHSLAAIDSLHDRLGTIR